MALATLRVLTVGVQVASLWATALAIGYSRGNWTRTLTVPTSLSSFNGLKTSCVDVPPLADRGSISTCAAAVATMRPTRAATPPTSTSTRRPIDDACCSTCPFNLSELAVLFHGGG